MRTVLALSFCLLLVAVAAKPKEKVEEEEKEDEGGFKRTAKDPCRTKHCRLGHECDLDEDGKAICICKRKCMPETEERAQVCSSHNVTFDSECELHRLRCLCHKDDPECPDARYEHAKVNYFGPCKLMEPCEEFEMQEYPKRMRAWLILVMEELARRKDLNVGEMKMLKETEKKNDKKWVLPVIWKFCDLDTTHDKLINTHELLPITAPLKPLEHCTGPFLEKCDADSNGKISLEEWGACLGLDKADIEDRCDAIRT